MSSYRRKPVTKALIEDSNERTRRARERRERRLNETEEERRKREERNAARRMYRRGDPLDLHEFIEEFGTAENRHLFLNGKLYHFGFVAGMPFWSVLRAVRAGRAHRAELTEHGKRVMAERRLEEARIEAEEERALARDSLPF